KNLKDGSSLSMELKAALGKSTVESEAVVFPVRTYTIHALVEQRPEITSVQGGGVEIPNDSNTIATSITITGTATPTAGQKVELQDYGVGIASIDVVNGIWTHTISLAVGAHSLTAKALYGSRQISEPPRALTVLSELIFDTSAVSLAGPIIWLNKVVYVWPPNTSLSRVASGGLPPYTYISSNPDIAAVDVWGNISSRGNGTATVTVYDSSNQTKSCLIFVSNVSHASFTGVVPYATAASRGRVLTRDELILVRTTYSSVHRPDPDWQDAGPSGNFWSSTSAGSGTVRSVHLYNGTEGSSFTAPNYASIRALVV
ncbi:hypothetical protein SAMN04487857_1501, partial [Pseudomonas sp. ok272]